MSDWIVVVIVIVIICQHHHTTHNSMQSDLLTTKKNVRFYETNEAKPQINKHNIVEKWSEKGAKEEDLLVCIFLLSSFGDDF